VLKGVVGRVRFGNVNCKLGSDLFFCRIEWMVDFECWRAFLHVIWSVERWWLLMVVVV
jgi:hypothetical protein